MCIRDRSYTVQYLEQETNKVLHNELVKLNVKFGSKVIEKAVDIPGYTAAVKEKTVEKLNYTNNVIKFYYTENQLVKIQYQVADGQNFMGSVTRSDEDVKPVTCLLYTSIERISEIKKIFPNS